MAVQAMKLCLFICIIVPVIPSPAPRIGFGKVLYILFDGFRYDYVDDQPPADLPGFNELLTNGVRAEWVQPIYPSVSYPSWTTLSTGLYAENHNIIGNYIYDPSDRTNFSLFDEESTGMKKWWTEEPLWITATKAGLKAALYLWSRCDVPYDGVLPDTCEKFVKIPGFEIFQTNIDKALEKFQAGYDLVQVYTEHLDYTGHNLGPETEERRQAVRDLDRILLYLQEQLRILGLEDEVNIVIASDHGMADTAPGSVTRIELDDYLPATGVEMVVDKGAYIVIKVFDGYLDEVYSSLLNMPGASVFKKEDIPEEYRVKEATYMHDIMILADIDHFILASNGTNQLPPRDPNYVYYGHHGFDSNEEKMRSIFFAKGPAFKKNVMLEPIKIVDIYQVVMNCLGVEALPHNGTWSSVSGGFVDGAKYFSGNAAPATFNSSAVLLLALALMLLFQH